MENNVLVKKPHTRDFYNDKQIDDFIKCADPVEGPKYFLSNFFYIQHPTKGKMLFDPFDYQIELVDTYHNNRFSINLLGRQMGKCLSEKVNITVKNNSTGKIYDIPIGVFYQFQKDKSIDISCYERKE